MLKKGSLFLTNNLPWFILAASLLGFLGASLASTLAFITPFLLALMVAGSGFSLSLEEVFRFQSANNLKLTLLTLLVQLGLLPLLGYGLYLLVPDSRLGLGLVALGVAPSEITSVLMTLLAGGNLVLATRLMVFSIFLTTFLTPLWLGLFLGQTVPLDLGGMVVELGLIVALPFLIASGLRTRLPVLADYETEFGGLSALAVVALIFVVGGSLNNFNLDQNVIWLALACLGFNIAGYLLGWLIGYIQNQKRRELLALAFSSGMREFGIASAVALNFLPGGAALGPALYGLIMMLSASLLATRFRAAVSP